MIYKKSSKRCLLLSTIVVIVCIIGLNWFMTNFCNWMDNYRISTDPSVLIAKKEFQNSPQVENGIAFDSAELYLTGSKKFVVSPSTVIHQIEGLQPNKVRIYMAKVLSYMGHPGKQFGIMEARRIMGCAVCETEDEQLLVVFGDWHSIEGGAHVDLVVQVGPNVEVIRRDFPRGFFGTDLFEPVYLPNGWKAISSQPDPKRLAYADRN